MNLKNIHIGQIIQTKVQEQGVKQKRILNYFDCDENFLQNMYHNKSIETDLLLKWCKLLKVDFFRHFVAHLSLYHAVSATGKKQKATKTKGEFKKNVYSAEVKQFVMQQVASKTMGITDIINKYNIPRTTLYTWIRKSS